MERGGEEGNEKAGRGKRDSGRGGGSASSTGGATHAREAAAATEAARSPTRAAAPVGDAFGREPPSDAAAVTATTALRKVSQRLWWQCWWG